MERNGPRAMEVEKADLFHTRIVTEPERELKKGEIRFAIEDFALTANNITYALFGESMEYWRFFPSSEPGWGRIPVWGFASVEESRHDAIEEGERYFGFLPMATELILQPERLREHGFSDASRHRRALSGFYNRYLRVAGDPAYRADYEPQQMLLRPLFTTAFLLDDLLEEQGFYGAQQVIISSASSKTAMALAWLIGARNIPVIALTSKTSRAFVRNSQIYARTHIYEEFADAIEKKPSLFIDFSGNEDLSCTVHNTLADQLKASIMVGSTNWRSGRKSETDSRYPGPERFFFFAPDQADIRAREWGTDEMLRRISHELIRFYKPASHWIKSVRGVGCEAIQESYDRLIRGEALPSEGFILSFNA